MHPEKFLLVILAMIIICVVVAGCNNTSKFSSNAASSAHDAIVTDLTNLGANAFQYSIKPTSMSGGGGSYIGYTIPHGLDVTATGYYSISTIGYDGKSIKFTGSSVAYPGNSVTVTYDITGKISGALDVSNWKPQE